MLAWVFLAFMSWPTQARTLDLSPLKVAHKDRAHVVVFVSPECPCSARYIGYLNSLAKEFPEAEFVAVNSNKGVDRQKAMNTYKEQKLALSLVDDPQLALADTFGAVKTPHAYLLDKNGEVVFEGGVADSTFPEKAKDHYLKEALTELRQGQKPKRTQARSLGCYIAR